MKPQDAEILARYQNYAKSSIKSKICGFDGDSEALLEKSESYLAKALGREISKVASENNMSENEALEKILNSKILQQKELSEDYLSALEDFIENANTVKL